MILLSHVFISHEYLSKIPKKSQILAFSKIRRWTLCGIVGILSKENKENIESYLAQSEAAQLHRGPNAQKREIYEVSGWGIGFEHQRLSVIDLSSSADQPMSTQEKKSYIIYNGEVYNYKEIKKNLIQQVYKSDGDTEVLLNALEQYGVDKAVNMFNGMWAFAWLDTLNNKLYLCRDRVGVKPLYYYIHDNQLFFASEIKTLLETSQIKFRLNYQSIGEYLIQSIQDTSSNTFFDEIKSVNAGHYIVVDLNKNEINLTEIKYWDVLDAIPYDKIGLVAHFKELFEDAVKIRMRSDVPVGVTLSGGIDSSIITAVMKKYIDDLGANQKLHIFSVVSPESKLDESEYIDCMLEHLKVQAHKINFRLEPEEAIVLLEKAIWYNDAPIGSFSNIAHFLMMQKAKELGVTVILSGQGEDEVLCGYKKYVGFYLQSLIRRKKILKAIGTLGHFFINRSILNQVSFSEAKRYLPTIKTKISVDVRGEKIKAHYKCQEIGLKLNQTLQQRQAEDLKKYSVPFLTHYEDRMSMAWSREIRLPFLDYRVMELLVNLPAEKKIKKGWTKHLLRQIAKDLIPKKIAWRKDKQGFVNPQEEWLRNELVDKVKSYFSESALIFKYGLLDRDALLKKYEQFCKPTGKSLVWYREILNPLSLEIWLQQNKRFVAANE